MKSFKFTIVVNQKVIIDNNYGIDIVDAAILNFIHDWSASNYSKRMIDNAILWVWISPNKIFEQLPILGIKQDTIYRRMKKLVKAEFLLAHPDNNTNSDCWYAITSLVSDMYFDKELDQPTSTTYSPPVRTIPEPKPDELKSHTFTLPIPKSDPPEDQIRGVGFGYGESKSDPSDGLKGSDLDSREVGFGSAYYNTIYSNTIVSSSVVVFSEADKKKENNNNSFSLSKEKFLEGVITAKHNAWLAKNPDQVPKIPDLLSSTQKNEPEAKHSPPAPPAPASDPDAYHDAIPVLDFIKIAGRPISRKAVETYVRDMHKPTIQRGQDWIRNHPGLDFDQIVSRFLYEIDQQKFDQQSYIISRFTWFSDDFMTGKRTLELLRKPPAPGSPESRNALPVSDAIRQASASRFQLPPKTHNASNEPLNTN